MHATCVLTSHNYAATTPSSLVRYYQCIGSTSCVHLYSTVKYGVSSYLRNVCYNLQHSIKINPKPKMVFTTTRYHYLPCSRHKLAGGPQLQTNNNNLICITAAIKCGTNEMLHCSSCGFLLHESLPLQPFGPSFNKIKRSEILKSLIYYGNLMNTAVLLFRAVAPQSNASALQRLLSNGQQLAVRSALQTRLRSPSNRRRDGETGNVL